MNAGAISSSGMMSSRTSPDATRCAIGMCRPCSTSSMNHARTRPSSTMPSSRVAAACVATSPSCSASSIARRNGSSAPSRSTSFADGANDSPAVTRRRSCPSSMHAASSPSRSPRSTARSRTSRASSAARSNSSAVRIAAARRSRTSISRRASPSASASAASSASPCIRSPGRRSMSSAWSRASRSPTRCSGVEADGSASSTTRRTSSGALAASALPTRLDREPDAHRAVAGRPRVAGDQRQAAGRGLARHQQHHDRLVDRPSRGRRERRGRELADLLVLEAVVGGRLLLVLDEQTRRDRRRQDLGQLFGSGCRPVHAELDLAQVLQAEAPAQDRRDGQQRLRVVGELHRPPRDQRLHRRRHQPLRVPGQRPDAVDLLDQPALAVGERHLLDDERDALGLRVHHRRARRVDRTAEHLRQEVARVRLREPVELEAAHDAHAAHVGDQVHRLGDDRELLGTDREHQEDRARPVGADHVPQQAEAVLVRPLEIVDQHGERPFGGQGAEGDGARDRTCAAAGCRGRGWRAPGRPDPTSSPGIGTARPTVLSSVAASTASGDPRIERATRNGPRSSSSAVTAIAVKPSALACSAAATSNRVLPMPGSPSTVSPTRRPALAVASSCAIAWSSAGRPDDVAGRPMDVERHRREGQRSVVVRDHLVSGRSGM